MSGPIYIYSAQHMTSDGSRTIVSDGIVFHLFGKELTESQVTGHALVMISDTSGIPVDQLVQFSFSYVEDPDPS